MRSLRHPLQFTPKKSMGRQKDAVLQFMAGGSAGFVEICLMHPLDLVKTRMQIQNVKSASGTRYTGVFDCMRTIYRSEGFGSFYKGILPPIMAEAPKRAIKFLTFSQYKDFFAHIIGNTSPPLVYSLAGLCSGLTEGLAITPFEVVKVQLQSERNVTLSQQRSSFAMAREIYARGGFGSNGLLKGLTSTLGRHGVWNMCYFGLYHSFNHMYPPSTDSVVANYAHRILVGFTAGSIASVANIPFDVAKSRIQGPQPDPGSVKYKTCFQTIALVRREEGFFALYKGLVPKVMRLGPGGAVMLIVFETVYDFLKTVF